MSIAQRYKLNHFDYENYGTVNKMSEKDKIMIAISYYVCANCLANLSDDIILYLSEQIALQEGIGKEYFISTFDLHHLKKYIEEIINQYMSIANRML